MKDVVIIGSGNVAEALAEAVVTTPYTLKQIYARNKQRGQEIGSLTNAEYTDDPAKLAKADIYIIAVNDLAIEKVAEQLHFHNDAVVVHTAGSVSIDELSKFAKNRAVLYPLQTFTQGRHVNFKDIPLFVESSNPYAEKIATDFAKALSDRIEKADSAKRMQLHLSAVFACNFSNHMYTIAQGLLKEHDLPIDIIKPLMAETAAKALESPSAALVQTGPAMRNDYQTKDKHMELLKDHPELQNLYKTISLNIWETSKKI